MTLKIKHLNGLKQLNYFREKSFISPLAFKGIFCFLIKTNYYFDLTVINDIILKGVEMKKGHIILNGNKKVMFSAPHAVEQTRDGKIKYAEPDTAVVAMAMNELGYPCIIKTENLNDDANFDLECDYKKELVSFVKENNIKALIDLHELSSFRQQDICLGTGGDDNKNLLGSERLIESFVDIFSKDFKNVSVNIPFAAKGDGTISCYISNKCNLPCVQIEMNSSIFMKNKIDIKQMANLLDKVANEMEKYDEKDITGRE